MKTNNQDGSTLLPQNHKDMNAGSIDLMNKMRLFGMAEAFRTSLGSTLAENMTPDAFLSMLLLAASGTTATHRW